MKKILLTLSILLLTIGFIWSYPFMIAYKDTYYAPGFSKENFQKVEIGMDQAEVEASLGEPLERAEIEGKTYFRYSGTKKDSYFFIKGLFLQNNKVVEKVDEFYVD